MTDWSKHQEALLTLQRQVTQRMAQSGQYGLDDPLSDALGELSAYDNHPADIASELFERGKDLALRDADKLRLQEIDRALTAMQNGTYGTCEKCRNAIPEARLAAYPMTTLCVDCKRLDEQAHPDRTRPVEEAYLWPGFGRSNLDETSAVAFDGEDSWQAVARFNERTDYENDYEQVELNDNEGIVDEGDRITNEDLHSQWS